MAIREFELDERSKKRWVDVTSPTKEELERISAQYHVPKSIVKDCLDPDHLPKYEKAGDYAFIILRLFNANPKQHAHSIQELTTKVAVFYNDDTLITLHRLEQPFVEEVKQQEIDTPGECYLSDLFARILYYALNTYQLPAITLDDQVDGYESTIMLKNTKPAMLQGLYYIKRKANAGRKILVLSTSVISFLETTDASKELVQDIRDQYTRLLTLYEEILDDVNNLMNTYLSLTSHKTNEVVKVLTIFSVFFMPLTFIVGIYGMNFDYMPELRQRYGYPVVMAIMLVLTVLIFIWFKKRRWL
jgi:magnesium transporter